MKVKDRPRAASVQICHPRGLVPTQVTLNFTTEPKPTSAWFAQIFIGMSFRQFASVFLLIITACESHDTGRSVQAKTSGTYPRGESRNNCSD